MTEHAPHGDSDALDMALLLVRLGHEDGGRVDPARIIRRPPTSRTRAAFMEAQDAGWLDGSGWVTDAGRDALRDAEYQRTPTQ